MSRLVVLVLVAGLVPLACGDDLPTMAISTTGPSNGSSTSTTTTSASSTSTTTDTGLDSSTGGDLPCGTDSPEALARCVDRDAVEDDVSFIADIRTPGNAHWLAVQEMCADRLTMLGFEIQMHEYATGINVVGRRPGTTRPEELVLVGAHYDHIPGCLGADDNATGVAGALEAARVLAPIETERTLAVGCWDEEELGLLGASAWVALGLEDNESVAVYYNYDMIGYVSDEPGSQEIPFGFEAIFPEQYMQVADNEFRGDFILMVADEFATESFESFERHAQTMELSTVGTLLDAASKNSELFSDLRRSDHAPFWAADIPALFFTDSANFRNEAYHCAMGEDSVDRLNFDFAASVVASTVGAMAEDLVLP